MHPSVKLPIDDLLPAILEALRAGPSVVIEAPPGAGKTTRVPTALLPAKWLGGNRIIMLEPRRLAARAAAGFMAAGLGETPGGTIGYRMRLDTRVGPDTRIEVVTEGVLTRMLQADPSLDGVGAILFDEFHERSLNADLGLALSLQARALLRPDLRIVVMSATLDGEPVAQLLGNAPIVRSRGRLHEVRTFHVAVDRKARIEDPVARTIRTAIADHEGDILAFLPGAAEIRATARRLEDIGSTGITVMPLFGNLSMQDQQRAIAPSPAGLRKVVLATSIAETSLTIEGVRIVIDSGLMRVPRFSPRNGMTRLETVRVTRDAADQRRGRAGRTAPGICYRLWSEGEEAGLVARRQPEILEADLAPLALELAAWGTTRTDELQWLDSPPAAAFAQALELLFELGAVDRAGRLTEHGKILARLPAHPRLAHMIARAAESDLASTAYAIAALVEERDPLRFDGPADPDLGLRLQLLERAERSGAAAVPDRTAGGAVDRRALARVLTAVREWKRRLAVDPIDHESAPSDIGLLLAFAYPDRIAKRRGGRGRFLLRNGTGARIPPEYPIAESEFIVAGSLGGHRGRESHIHLAAPVERAQLMEQFATQIEQHVDIAWHSASRSVRAERTERLGAIVLGRAPVADVPQDRIARAIMDGIRADGFDTIPWSDADRSVLERLRFLDTVDDSWPDVSADHLLETLEAWLGPWLLVSGTTGPDSVDLGAALLSRLDPAQRARFDAAAPTHIEVPSGSRIRLDYSDPAAPALPVRLQEVFGLRATPRIADGAVPVTMRLLSPAMRPVQVTRDLASFWREGYFEVRKDLRGRYPKHYWPENPLDAQATRRTRPR